MSERTFIIDCFPESARRYTDCAVAVVDVIRATTMAVTAAAQGRKCHYVTSVQEAEAVARRARNAVLAGELKGIMPAGFDMNNSPAELAARTDTDRPLILLSSSGTQLMRTAEACKDAYIACLRNYVPAAQYMAGKHSRIALIGAGSRGEFREEDQLCCAWMGRELLEMGYCPGNDSTLEVVRRWENEEAARCGDGASAEYLRRTGQLQDLDFILDHVSDLDQVMKLERGKVVTVSTRVEPMPQRTLLASATA